MRFEISGSAVDEEWSGAESPAGAGVDCIGTKENVDCCDSLLAVDLTAFGGAQDPNALCSWFPDIACLCVGWCGWGVLADLDVKNDLVIGADIFF